MTFPDDENGDVLRRIEAGGNNLSVPRDVDFTIVFPDEDSAEQYAKHFREQGFVVSVEFAKTVPELPWDVIVVKHMALTHREIGEFEASLQEVADSLGGRNDGWGCFSGPN